MSHQCINWSYEEVESTKLIFKCPSQRLNLIDRNYLFRNPGQAQSKKVTCMESLHALLISPAISVGIGNASTTELLRVKSLHSKLRYATIYKTITNALLFGLEARFTACVHYCQRMSLFLNAKHRYGWLCVSTTSSQRRLKRGRAAEKKSWKICASFDLSSCPC